MKAFALLLLLLLALPVRSDVPLVITICGGANYDCPTSDNTNYDQVPGHLPLAPGAYVPSVEVDTNKPGSNSDPTVTIPTKGSPGDASPAPAVSPTAAPIPSLEYCKYSHCETTMDAICNWLAQQAGGSAPARAYVNGAYCGLREGNLVQGETAVPQWDYIGSPTSTISCPTGYQVSGGGCNLQDARQAQPDGKVDFKRSPDGGFEAASSNDADGAANSHVQTPGTPKRIEVGGYDSGGRPVHLAVTNDGAGGSNLLYTQGSNPTSGSTTINQFNYNINANGIVVGATQSQGAGNLVINQTTGAATLVPVGGAGGSGVQNPGGGGAGLDSPGFPSDYAREATLQAIKNALTLPGTAPSDPSARTSTDIEDQFFKTTFSGIKTWSLPSHTSTCPTASFYALGATRTFDSHCALINDHWGLLSAVMLVVWSILALFVVMRA